MNWQNRTYCNGLTVKDDGKKVTLYGWIDTIRDHGGLLFIHIRDISGILQIVADPDSSKDAYTVAETCRSEFVIEVTGDVKKRTEENINPNVQSGDIEIHITDLTILTSAQTPPFIVSEKELTAKDSDDTRYVDEDIRLQYRYLDLRRQSMKSNIIKRAQMIQTIRRYLDDRQFLDIETPVLTKSTPEGARDYIVPSRHHPGKVYALPQSPQLFKQLLMVSGFERYYQIVKCFRDEDLRPNRQPEFTQLDLEASFIDEAFIIDLIEGLLVDVFKQENITLQRPFKQFTYDEAMDKYGSDKPDLRPGLEMISVTDCFDGCNYKIFNSIISSGGAIKGICLKNQADQLSKNLLQNELAGKVIQQCGGKGLTWMKYIEGEFQSNIVQFFTPENLNALKERLGAEENDVIFLVADTKLSVVNDVLGRFRLHIAKRQGLLDPSVFIPCWVTHFPLFEEKDGKLSSMHHPFTQPEGDLPDKSDIPAMLQVKSRAYDIAMNGEELGGGSIRIHDGDTQKKMFDALGLSEDDIDTKFGFFNKALGYGTPPHGGIALGIDRLASMLLKQESIREVIAFPKNRVAYCPLTQAPSTPDQAQLDELNLSIQEMDLT